MKESAYLVQHKPKMITVGAASTNLWHSLYILYPAAHQALQVFAMYITPHHNVTVTPTAAF
jgi:hypothetical protein